MHAPIRLSASNMLNASVQLIGRHFCEIRKAEMDAVSTVQRKLREARALGVTLSQFLDDSSTRHLQKSN
jgi:hypothetical protein